MYLFLAVCHNEVHALCSWELGNFNKIRSKTVVDTEMCFLTTSQDKERSCLGCTTQEGEMGWGCGEGGALCYLIECSKLP